MLVIVIPALLLLVERAQAATPSKEIPAIPGRYASAVIIALSTSLCAMRTTATSMFAASGRVNG
jgi:hypothetical protein